MQRAGYNSLYRYKGCAKEVRDCPNDTKNKISAGSDDTASMNKRGGRVRKCPAPGNPPPRKHTKTEISLGRNVFQ